MKILKRVAYIADIFKAFTILAAQMVSIGVVLAWVFCYSVGAI